MNTARARACRSPRETAAPLAPHGFAKAILLRLLTCLALLWLPATLHADARSGLSFLYTEIVAIDDHYVVNAAIGGAPQARLEELVQAGVSVPFVAEFVLTRARWYWFDEIIVQRVMDVRLSYHALTRQYRLTVGGLHRSFPSYDQAYAALLSLRNWVVADSDQLPAGQSLNAALRFRIDISQLPKPFQVAALGNRDLDISTNWARWTFLAGAR
ncbi:DUF4390 domain-containing protein [Uliginosibacterium sp. H3]|uniref:DUF4390 domain-containing protein n=1 Tax=Uliginosibacterium silvisoli TaxID=3114758 RepID=A0ABU6K1C7_9RHOO|nr:DUF4390 domain-containing protein [Uliginosibacterium sp. H3]